MKKFAPASCKICSARDAANFAICWPVLPPIRINLGGKRIHMEQGHMVAVGALAQLLPRMPTATPHSTR